MGVRITDVRVPSPEKVSLANFFLETNQEESTKHEHLGRFIPRGWNLFFSGTGTADFHPEVLEKARPISPLAEIRQNNSRKNCGNDLNSTLWFAPFYCLCVRRQNRDY